MRGQLMRVESRASAGSAWALLARLADLSRGTGLLSG